MGTGDVPYINQDAGYEIGPVGRSSLICTLMICELFFFFFNLFIYGCVGSLFLCEGFL